MSDTPKDYVVLNNTGDEIKRILDSEESTSPGQFYKNEDTLNEHIDSNDIHVTKSDKEKWNQKLGENHRKSLILDHPDGSVTKEKLSKEVIDILNSINGDSYTKEQVDDLFSKLGDTISVIMDGSDIKSKEKQGIYTDGNSYLIVTGDYNDGARYYFDKSGLSVQIMKDKVHSDWISIQLSSDESLTTEDKTLVGAINEVNSRSGNYVLNSQYASDRDEQDKKISKKTEETVLYEDVVNTPEWTNQPTYEGTLDSAFSTTDFYYITLKDVDGNALPEGKFMLKSTFDTTATVYPTVFTLADLNTGTSTLVENFPVEFTAIDTQVRMRNAGVWKISYTPENWKLNGNRGRLRLVCDGQFIQRTANAYFVNMCSVNKNVSHYHSISSTAFQNDTTKQIICYATLSGSYKTNKFYDDMVIERVSDTCYATKRNVTIRYIKNASSDYTVSSYQVFGHGEIPGNTRITELCIQVAVDTNRGFIRNGSVIRITEVK